MSFGGSQDEIQRLIMQVEGASKVEALTKDLDLQKKAMADLAAQQRGPNRQSLQQYTTAMEAAAQKSVQLNAQLREAKGAMGNFGGVLMQTGYIVDDFVAGLNNQGLAAALANVQNNIPGLLVSLGKGAGLAGVIGLAGVAVAQLVRHWHDLEGLWSDTAAADAAVLAEKRIEEAAKSATDAVEAQINALRRAETAGKPEQAEIVKAAIGEAGGVDATVNATRAAMLAESPDVKAATENVNKAFNANAKAANDVTNPMAQLRALVAIKKAQRERDEATARVEANSKSLVARASTGDADAIRELARLNPNGAFDQATPEAIRAQDQEVRAADEEGAALHTAGQRRAANRQDARDRDRQIAAFNRRNDQAKAAGAEGAKKRRDALFNQPDVLGDNLTPEQVVAQARQQRRDQRAAFLGGAWDGGMGGGGLDMLEQQASQIAEQMMIGNQAGFDTSGLQRQLNMIQQQYNLMRAQLSRGMGGQMNGQFSALPMFQGGN